MPGPSPAHGTPGTPGAPGTPGLLRAINDRAALELLLEHGPLSRAAIGRMTGLSKPTSSQLLARLEAAGLVRVTGTSGGGPGPGAQLYGLDPAAGYVAGLDVTPGGIRAAVADITGTVVGTHETAADGSGGAGGGTGGSRGSGGGAVAEQVARTLDRALARAGLGRADVRRTVVATPGAFDPRTGLLRYADHLPGWHSPALLDELAAVLPAPVRYENDVNLVAVAERRLGAARGHEDFVLLWNEEGLGAALVLGGRLHRGWTGGAGEVGFLPVPGGPPVRGVRRLGSGGYQQLAGAQAVPALAAELGITAAPAAGTEASAAAVALLAAAAARPEGPHLVLLHRYATALATGLAALVAVLDPEVVVLCGAVTAAGGEPLRELVEAELAELAPSSPRLVAGAVRDRPVLRGALESALAAVREEVFDTSRSARPAQRGRR
ncbi:ROK family protein [Streptomyces sp. NPDC012888]|uniref:ROK family transcriptional regulator n=1 Tax=Streptomyces sp. NPDC012888 TaxID=3364855 RepID=UPI00367EA26E